MFKWQCILQTDWIVFTTRISRKITRRFVINALLKYLRKKQSSFMQHLHRYIFLFFLSCCDYWKNTENYRKIIGERGSTRPAVWPKSVPMIPVQTGLFPTVSNPNAHGLKVQSQLLQLWILLEHHTKFLTRVYEVTCWMWVSDWLMEAELSCTGTLKGLPKQLRLVDSCSTHRPTKMQGTK